MYHRFQSWAAIRRTIILVGLAYGFLCRIGRMGKTVIEFLNRVVRTFRDPKKVWAYRMRRGLAQL